MESLQWKEKETYNAERNCNKSIALDCSIKLNYTAFHNIKTLHSFENHITVSVCLIITAPHKVLVVKRFVIKQKK